MSGSNGRFRRGSGAYACSDCGRTTRETGQGESGVDLCRTCYEAAGDELRAYDAATLAAETAPTQG